MRNQSVETERAPRSVQFCKPSLGAFSCVSVEYRQEKCYSERYGSWLCLSEWNSMPGGNRRRSNLHSVLSEASARSESQKPGTWYEYGLPVSHFHRHSVRLRAAAWYMMGIFFNVFWEQQCLLCNLEELVELNYMLKKIVKCDIFRLICFSENDYEKESGQ